MFEDSPYCILHNILLGITKSLITSTIKVSEFENSAMEAIDERIKRYQKNAVPMFKEESFRVILNCQVLIICM